MVRECFDVVIVSAEAGLWKPDPRILLAAADELTVEPRESVYVGDSDVDIQAAGAAGMRSILIRRTDGPSDPLRGRPDPDAGATQPDLVIARPFLHARRLEFTHPGTSERVHFESDLPEDLRLVLASLA